MTRGKKKKIREASNEIGREEKRKTARENVHIIIIINYLLLLLSFINTYFQ